MTTFEVWPWLQKARWFSGKSRLGRISDHQALDWYPSPDASLRVRSELVTVTYDTGQSERYHVPLSYRAEPLEPCLGRHELGYVCDATSDPAAMRIIVDAIAASTSTASYSCVDVGASSLPTREPIRVFGGEQSNTSVFVGPSIAKIFRKIEPGRNLDIDVHDKLRGCDVVAQLYGWISSGGDDLMMLIEALPNPEDGFMLATSGRDFQRDAREIGKALACVHDRLAATGVQGSVTGETLAKTFRARLHEVAQEVPALEPFADAIAATYDGLKGRSFPTQNIHGDFHLGQTLRSNGAWKIVDFEGEPMKTMAERRKPDSPWRDIAGALRSFDYAAHAINADNTWRDSLAHAFLVSYQQARGIDLDTVWISYELDKAVYEVLYESRNRIEFVNIPLLFISTTIKEN